MISTFEDEGLPPLEDDASPDSSILSIPYAQETSEKTIDDSPFPSSKIYTIPHHLCTPWDYSDRPTREMGDIEQLAESIKNSGQQEPILVREKAKNNNNQPRFEIIFGHRRWTACQFLDVPVKAIIKNISDQDASKAQKEENENRENLSDFSRAKSYKKLLDKGVFSSISEMAKKLNIQKTTLVNLLSYTRISKAILNEMPNPEELKVKSAIKLASISSQGDEQAISVMASHAKDICSGKISSSSIDSLLTSSSRAPSYKKSCINNKGRSLFTVSEKKDGSISVFIAKNEGNSKVAHDVFVVLEKLLLKD